MSGSSCQANAQGGESCGSLCRVRSALPLRGSITLGQSTLPVDSSTGFGTRGVDQSSAFAYPCAVKSWVQVREVADRLRQAFGSPESDASDPVETLVLTILSQNTNDRNRDRAYAALRTAYRDWDAVRTAPQDELADIIRPGGLHHQKARHIQQALERIPAVGKQREFDLGFLEPLSMNEALAWLTELPGVGKKTAGIVLLFSFRKPYFPVDTHIARIARRLGWIEPSDRDPHDALNARIESDSRLMQHLHLSLIALGRSTCHARRPACGACPLEDLCPTGMEIRATSEKPGTRRRETE